MNVTLTLSTSQLQQLTSTLQSALQGISAQITNLQSSVDQVLKGEQQIMPGITDIQTAQQAEKTDLATLGTQITNLLAAFASGAMTPAQAQALLTEINAEDASIKTQISAIQAALPATTTTP